MNLTNLIIPAPIVAIPPMAGVPVVLVIILRGITTSVGGDPSCFCTLRTSSTVPSLSENV